MGVPGFGAAEEEIKKWVRSIALIVLSEEFQELKNELEKVYRSSGAADPAVAAFQDALYAFLAEREEETGF
ncbi:MAG: hypothetical protein ACPLRH_01720 [Desulfotomaculales bacterium]